jgi:mono/diheme cytochrome c family protein
MTPMSAVREGYRARGEIESRIMTNILTSFYRASVYTARGFLAKDGRKAMRSIRQLTWLPTLTIVSTAALGAMLAIAAGKEEWKAPPAEAAKKNPAAVSDESLAAGKESYEGQCADCHGLTGKNDGKKVAELKKEEKDRMTPLTDPSVAKQSDGELFWKISEGKKPMPAGKKLMEPDEIWNVVNYIRTFGKK